MLDGGLDEMYRAALATSHQPYVRVEVLDGSQNVLESDLVFNNGTVTATLTSRVSRQCQLAVAESLYPFEVNDLLAPYGNMIRAWRGIEFADGTRFAWVVFVGRIQQVALTDGGTCTVQAADFAADVLENRFVVPENSQPLSSVTSEVVRLITDGFPQATFGTVESFDIPARTRTWQLDRGQALDELSTSVGAFWYPQADGAFTLRSYPWTVVSPTVVTLTDTGVGAVVTESRSARSRADTYNSLTVTGERLNGDLPVYALAQDTNPDSPTYVNGNFGRRHQLMRLQTPGSQGAALGAANENLRRIISLFDSWSWNMSVDASLELGDTVGLAVRDRIGIVQVVAGMRIPLDLSSDMEVVGRSRVAINTEGEV
jgi:uncharacterized protein DUF5047